jgi:hypothetical protein
VLFTSPTTHGKNYSTIAFETDLRRIEAATRSNPPFCDCTGANCVNPRNGRVLPVPSTTFRHVRTLQEGGLVHRAR